MPAEAGSVAKELLGAAPKTSGAICPDYSDAPAGARPLGFGPAFRGVILLGRANGRGR